MNPLSPWAAAASAVEKRLPIHRFKTAKYTFEIYLANDCVWIDATWPGGGYAMFRAAYSAGSVMSITSKRVIENEIELQLSSHIGRLSVQVSITDLPLPVLRYTTQLTPAAPMMVPFWPRDILFPGHSGHPGNTAGKILVQQVGTRSGQLYLHMTRPKTGAMLYLQNLTALGAYCEQTHTSCADVVGGQWPELGFALPAATSQPLEQDKTVTIGDAFAVFDPIVPNTEARITQQYLNLLAQVYLQLPQPQTICHDWYSILGKGLHDLIHNHGCWTQVQGKPYLNAYVCDYNTPPEIMVQLAVLLPLVDYAKWKEEQPELITQILDSLPSFYNDELKTVMRWLPAAEGQLTGDEEQKKPLVMDSWYLHHPLLNLSRLALKGNKKARDLFLGSLDFAIRVARHFNYRWPVFYKMDTLEIVKAETQPGKGGEKDVAGIYTHVMMQAWELTGEGRYLTEAKKAARTLKGLGFDLFYQANNTSFAAGALLRLYKVTRDKAYLHLSYTCIANILRNTRLWNCDYGYGKSFPSFFAMFPLNDAPYTAAYEEHEVFCAFHDYLEHGKTEDILPSVKMLISEYIRHLINRAPYYYPSMLPPEALAENVKTGELDPDLWIVVEDLHDGWEKNGGVGQEVYGAGNAFGIAPRHYIRITGHDFFVFCDYPISSLVRRDNMVRFTVNGDPLLYSRLMIVKTTRRNINGVVVAFDGIKQGAGEKVKGGNRAYQVKGGCRVVVTFN